MAETTRHGPGSLVGQTFYDVDGLGAWQRIAIVPGELRSAGAAREVLVVESAACAGRDLLCLGGWGRQQKAGDW